MVIMSHRVHVSMTKILSYWLYLCPDSELSLKSLRLFKVGDASISLCEEHVEFNPSRAFGTTVRFYTLAFSFRMLIRFPEYIHES
jgi:hypothetical protein